MMAAPSPSHYFPNRLVLPAAGEAAAALRGILAPSLRFVEAGRAQLAADPSTYTGEDGVALMYWRVARAGLEPWRRSSRAPPRWSWA
jgi:hypothetical protein